MPVLILDLVPHGSSHLSLPYEGDTDRPKAFLAAFQAADALDMFSDLSDASLARMAHDWNAYETVNARLKAGGVAEWEYNALYSQLENLRDNSRCLPMYKTYRVLYDQARQGNAASAMLLMTSDHYVRQFVREE